jgi:hypothetical protein
MILTHSLLHPIAYCIQDPFASICETMEAWLAIHQPEYLLAVWPKVKQEYVKRILKISKKGSALRGYAQKAPVPILKDTLLEIYDLLDHCMYFISKYWRAFYYYLKTGELNSIWLQFGQREVDLIFTMLSEEEINQLKIKAEQEWPDLFSNTQAINKFFKKLQKPLNSLYFKRISFLRMYDPAKYAQDDMLQEINMKVATILRQNDYITSDPYKMTSYALKCADNAIHNLRGEAMANKRSRIILASNESESDTYKELSLNSQMLIDDEDVTLLESIQLLGDMPFKDADIIENNICLEQLIAIASPKIQTYLKTVCAIEHNLDFWSWFYYHERELAQRPIYVQEHPEAIGMYVQRHLNLPTHELTKFLFEHLPSLRDRKSNNFKVG